MASVVERCEKRQFDRTARGSACGQSAHPTGPVKNVTMKNHLEPGIGGKGPHHTAVFAGAQKRIHQYDQERTGCGKKVRINKRRGAQPASFCEFPLFWVSLARLDPVALFSILIPQHLHGIRLESDTLTGWPTRNASVSCLLILAACHKQGLIGQPDVIMGIRPEINDVFKHALQVAFVAGFRGKPRIFGPDHGGQPVARYHASRESDTDFHAGRKF